MYGGSNRRKFYVFPPQSVFLVSPLAVWSGTMMPPFAKAFAAQRRIGAVLFRPCIPGLCSSPFGCLWFSKTWECHSLYFVQRSNVGGLSACLTQSAAPGGTYIPFQPSCLLNASIRLVCLPFRTPLWHPLDPLISFLCLKLLHLPPAWLL